MDVAVTGTKYGLCELKSERSLWGSLLSAAFGRQSCSQANVKCSPKSHGRDYTLHLTGGVVNWIKCSTLLPAGGQPLG